tara:strand:+ start:905 stop:1975 length:1071 start_codon:yes stop_codon:yes gene_type:complete
MKFLVTGGSGFIGSSLIKHLINDLNHEVVNVDKLTYAGNPESLEEVENSSRYEFEHADICDSQKLKLIFDKHMPDKVMHLAAESHVDRSIDAPGDFIQTNIVGTYVILETARKYWENLAAPLKKNFRFHHISTDEVYGDLEKSDDLFLETTPYSPSSPYSASKASSDHLVRSWNRTFGLPIVISNCSNNYGPNQFPEKLIPLVILNIVNNQKLPIYGNGSQVRDWLYVDDHAKALLEVILKGGDGETYNIGGHNEKTNLEVVLTICRILDKLLPKNSKKIKLYEELISYVTDRPGHDLRYAIDASKIQNELGWVPKETFESGIFKTIKWYLSNEKWWSAVQDGSYRGERLGLDNIS